MAKIIKLNVYEKNVYAVQVEDNLYIDELGVKHLSPSPENCKNTRNVPPALRTALEHLAKNHTARKKVEDKAAWLRDGTASYYACSGTDAGKAGEVSITFRPTGKQV